jgi:hypothetical protein
MQPYVYTAVNGSLSVVRGLVIFYDQGMLRRYIRGELKVFLYVGHETWRSHRVLPEADLQQKPS